jgi:hypothetical protein
LSASHERHNGLSNGFEGQSNVEPRLNSGSDPTLVPREGAIARVDDLTSAGHQPSSPNERDSPRLDVDDEGNQPRFYGPSSQRYIHDRRVPRDADLGGPLTDADAELNIDSAPVRNLLLQTFWKAQPLSQA